MQKYFQCCNLLKNQYLQYIMQYIILDIVILYINYFVLDLKIKAKIKAKITAAAIPPAVASSPPVNAPSNPFDFTALIAPFASDAPKPIIGTFIPAFANSEIGANKFKACNTTPIKTKVTKILAEVMFV